MVLRSYLGIYLLLLAVSPPLAITLVFAELNMPCDVIGALL